VVDERKCNPFLQLNVPSVLPECSRATRFQINILDLFMSVFSKCRQLSLDFHILIILVPIPLVSIFFHSIIPVRILFSIC